jgi:Zn-dependent protease/predicted transcriptional regulator
MFRGFRVAKLFGIDIIIDQSWFLIFVFISWSFSSGFAEQAGGLRLSGGAYFAMGLAAAFLFFSSLVAHELGHSLVARTKGIEVASITLFIFGGIARIKSEPKTPRDELKIALAGPAVSVVLGGLFLGVGWLASLVGTEVASQIFLTIGAVNLMLAVFNMLPGFPLDGGRVLRAAVWAIRKDFVRATKIAARAGQVVAWLMIGAGVATLVWTRSFRGLWLILIATFLFNAARMSYRQVLMKSSVSSLVVSDVMTRNVVSIPGNVRLDEALDDYFVRYRHTSFPVVGYGDQVEGILTLQQIKDAPREKWTDTTVRQVMTILSPEVSADPAEPVSSLLERLERNPIGRFAVMAGGRLIGILTTSDLARHFRVAAQFGGPHGSKPAV